MKYLAIAVFLLVLLSSAWPSLLDQYFTPVFYENLEKTYNKRAVKTAKQWRQMMDENQAVSDFKKLQLVNDFFNSRIQYKNDLPLWGKDDYWASPVETIGRGAGDCEDYAIAKFFSLTAMGIPEDKLRLMYVRQLDVDLTHMVLIYYENNKSIPLVLDNYNSRVLPANKRTDLKPIYSFNGQGLWMSKAKGLGRKVENSQGVSAWTTLLQRIEQGEMQTKKTAS